MSLYLMADPHFDDEYMLNYAGRGIFDSVESMNKAILKNSMCLNDDDTIIYVGDFCSRDSSYLGVYRNILNKIRGKKILVLGNHDKLEPFQYIDVGFHSVHTSLEMSIDGIEFVVVHDPSNSCMDRSKLFLCGHTHDFIKVRKNVICLCVELWHYTPVKWNTIKELYIEMKSNNFNITR